VLSLPEVLPALHRLAAATESASKPAYYYQIERFHDYSRVLFALTLVVALMVSGVVFNKLVDLVMLVIAGLKLRMSKE
jgi:hypothetical protein